MVIAFNWLAHFIGWTLLGSAWALIRGDQYNYNLNSTVLFNYAMSDTKGFQNSIKSGSYGLIMIVIWQVMSKLGSPIPVPKQVPPNGGRGRREAGGEEEWDWEIQGDVFFSPPPNYKEDVIIPAINQNLEPNGIGRNMLINTVIGLAQTIFWIVCTLFLPQM